MSIKNLVYFSLVIGLLNSVQSCTTDVDSAYEQELEQLLSNKDKYILPDSDDFASIPQTAANPLTNEKVALGKLLFHEPIFANESRRPESKFTYTCASCHVADAGFKPARQQGIADGAYGFGIKGESRSKLPTYQDTMIDAQGARPLAVINTAFVTNTMWNGSFGSDGVNVGTENMWGVFDPTTILNNENFGSLEGQNIAGLKTHRMMYNKEIVENAGYKKLFDEAFPTWSDDERYSRKAASFAISAYLRTLISNQAPFQKWLKGDKNAMSEIEKHGASIFFGKASCNTCHNQKNLGSMQFAALGAKDHFEMGGLNTSINDRRNLGRGGFTGNADDMYKFRTPQLYNVGDAGPYFHGGSLATIEDVVNYFNNGIVENNRVPKEQIHSFIKPIGLNGEEVKALSAFLKTGLRDPDLKRYVPTSVLSGLCFPNNDLASKIDMDCD